jgi:hypothetical protein
VSEPVYECDCCGACCRAFPILVTRADARREPRIAVEAKRFDEPNGAGWAFQLFPLPFQESCVFLDGQDRCEIHDRRPDVCREFAAGSELCQEARRMHGMEELEPIHP